MLTPPTVEVARSSRLDHLTWRVFARLLHNLGAGAKLALGIPRPSFVPSLGQLIALILVGWIFVYLDDWRVEEGAVQASLFGFALAAGRSYVGLGLLALVAVTARRPGGFLGLATACSAADASMWLVWMAASTSLAGVADPAAIPLEQALWWAMLVWQSLIMMRALHLDGLRFGWSLLALGVAYGSMLSLTHEFLPAEPLFTAPAVAAADPVDIEAVYAAQAGLLERQFLAVSPGLPNHPDLFFLGFAGVAEEGVFRREVGQVSDLMARTAGTARRSVRLVNSRRTLTELPLASGSNLGSALQSLAQKMDVREDILFLFLTSHGTSKGNLVIDFPSLGLHNLTPAELSQMLDRAGIQWRVLVVNACYSGAFLPVLANPQSLVITSSASNRASFGCAHARRWTYFGRAFFRDALGVEQDFIGAFEAAKKAIGEREEREGKESSQPQIAVGSQIAGQLARWRAASRPPD